jgi:hypothetical protein
LLIPGRAKFALSQVEFDINAGHACHRSSAARPGWTGLTLSEQTVEAIHGRDSKGRVPIVRAADLLGTEKD